MTLLALSGLGTPVGSVTPDYKGQHYIDTTPASEVAYIARTLLASGWQEIGGGGGGGGAVVEAINYVEYTFESASYIHNFDPTVDKHQYLSVGDLGGAFGNDITIEIAPQTAISSTQLVRGTITVAAESSTPNLNIAVEGDASGSTLDSWVYHDRVANTTSEYTSTTTIATIIVTADTRYNFEYTIYPLAVPEEGGALKSMLILELVSSTSFTATI